ncbi:succinylglutamate desuccinylase/aspartoacylase family protein [Methanobrevibacter sp.]|uniref:succinylglutamate desuccinylase/aspartoacylase domain-containing protein n=1 Tax=Methanobrevibacter sp. TaxID=66852 RepID=UPI00386F03E9
MKKIYLMLALILLMFSLSIVSASEDVSVSNDTLCMSDDLSVLDKSVDNNVMDDSNKLMAENDDSLGVASQTDKLTASKNTTSDVASNTTVNNTNKTNETPVKKSKPAKPAKVITKNIKSEYGTVENYNVKVLDENSKPIEGQKVKVSLGAASVEKYTDANGIATFTCKCKAGSYVLKYKVGTLTGSNTYVVKNSVKLEILKWGLKGDVSKNTLIKKNMPNNAWVKKAVTATKKGIPLLTIKGGSGKVVFMTAGVHGNEISSQVAAMKMIDYLTTHPIKGTVYFMPFVNVKAISKKVRYTDKDFNRIAHKSGTIPNKIVKLVVRYECDAYGDFHTTKPGGVPGKNIVMGSKTPAKQSEKLTKYIAKKCNVNQKIYKYAGEQYPGGINDNVNKKGIPAVICEVMLPHNTVTTKTVKTSYNMMKYLLKYYAIL